jgi:hypothetical protein
MPSIEFKYQTLFTCSVPDGYKTIKDFSELISSDTPQTEETILQTLKLSFDAAGVHIARLDISADLNQCLVLLVGETAPLRIVLHQRPSLVIDGTVYKLEPFDI